MSRKQSCTKTFLSQCCDDLNENEEDVVNHEDLRRKILLHPGPFVKPRNVIRKLTRSRARTETVVDEMRALQELGYGTLYCRGAVQKALLKVVPDKLPAGNLLVDRAAYIEQFSKEDSLLQRTESAIFREAHPDL